LRGYPRLVKLLREARTVLVIGHQNSDPDAVCSGYAFAALARRINRKVKVTFASPAGVSKLSKQILQTIALAVTRDPEMSEMDLIVTIDTNTLQQLGELREPVLQSGKPLVMIDHHAPHPENRKTATFVICDEQATSTCEMVLDMYRQSHLVPSKAVSQALLVGLLVETGYLSIATRRTFESAYSLIQSGAEPEEAREITRTTMDYSERIARIKSAQRVRVEHMDKWVVALSEVGSYHASAARALVALGAHLAIVAGQRNDELTISFRATRDFVSATGMHLGRDLANPLGVRMNGMGGGHATAAGANVSGNVNEALKLSRRLIQEFLSRPPKHNTTTTGNAQASSQTSVITQE
jgi:phosphoesterase RecJ-like protein